LFLYLKFKGELFEVKEVKLIGEKKIKLTETVSLPNYEKLKGVEASKMPMHEVIRSKNDNEFVEV